MGRSALETKGDARFYGAWRVLNSYGSDRLTWPLAAKAHTVLSTTLGELGDHVSALDHMTAAAAFRILDPANGHDKADDIPAGYRRRLRRRIALDRGAPRKQLDRASPYITL